MRKEDLLDLIDKQSFSIVGDNLDDIRAVFNAKTKDGDLLWGIYSVFVLGYIYGKMARKRKSDKAA